MTTTIESLLRKNASARHALIETTSPPKRFRAVDVGERVVIGLRGGGIVEGTVTRRLPGALVVAADARDLADVVVIEAATHGARVRREVRS